VQLRRLQDADEHEDESTPSEDHLHEPPEWLCRESGELAASAITRIPECAAAPVGPTLMFAANSEVPPSPRGITVSSWGVGIHSAAQLPRSNNQDPHGLDVNKDSRKQCPQSWGVNLETRPPPALFAPPIHELCEVQHHRHHQGHLETMEEIHNSCARTTVHERCADVQQCSDNHRPTSGTNDGWERQTKHTNCTDELARRHRLHIFVSITTSRS